jgi:hypothetical protein
LTVVLTSVQCNDRIKCYYIVFGVDCKVNMIFV